ncbi:hypothetical protein [Botryobacter ruber]|uniref:hypothetical protein n=1 Tax=Botryobacter ruber TaxID=2171629 RepID=UPI000FEC9949|nr:hypothetical protein [Botryobacter ruber]
MKKLHVFALMLLLLSCSETKEPTTPETPFENIPAAPEIVAADTATPAIDAAITTGIYSTDDFEEKSFVMSNATRGEICRVERGCDCCLSDLLFLSADTFVLSSYCEGSQIVNKGKYSVNRNEMTFHIDPLSVSYEYNWEREVDSTALPLYFLKAQTQEPRNIKFTIATCEASPILLSDGVARIKEPGTELARENTEASVAEIINGLKEKGIWDKLKI